MGSETFRKGFIPVNVENIIEINVLKELKWKKFCKFYEG